MGLYGYVGGFPVHTTDPSGLLPKAKLKANLLALGKKFFAVTRVAVPDTKTNRQQQTLLLALGALKSEFVGNKVKWSLLYGTKEANRVLGKHPWLAGFSTGIDIAVDYIEEGPESLKDNAIKYVAGKGLKYFKDALPAEEAEEIETYEDVVGLIMGIAENEVVPTVFKQQRMGKTWASSPGWTDDRFDAWSCDKCRAGTRHVTIKWGGGAEEFRFNAWGYIYDPDRSKCCYWSISSSGSPTQISDIKKLNYGAVLKSLQFKYLCDGKQSN
jgi:hypothetical protein